MIVVDTNIISYFYLNSDYSQLAEQTFKKDPILILIPIRIMAVI